MSEAMNLTIIGGGMITHDQLLPSIYHLQRLGVVGTINICALNSPPLKALKEEALFETAFPGQGFTPFPALSEPADAVYPELYKEVIAGMAPRRCVVVAVPDQFHYPIVKEALGQDQHVVCVKPLVLRHEQALELEKLALEKGLFVGIEYHKRFDRRALIARREYRSGGFGEFVMGEANLIEPYYYRHSNFQNWFTPENTDPFVYVGCHYTDLVYFITGLRPASASVAGVKGKFPNGNDGYLWSHARIGFENGALLSVVNGLGYPDDSAGSNDQGLVMYCEGDGKTGLINHNDQFRGVAHGLLSGKSYKYVNPDFFNFVPWTGEGLKPIGYGYDSAAALIGAVKRIEDESSGLAARQEMIREIDRKGLLATPANSACNELLHEAARHSILNGGQTVEIVYGESPRIVASTT